MIRAFWQMRQVLGQATADQLVADAAQVLQVFYPRPVTWSDDLYRYVIVKRADAVRDNRESRLPTIEKIWKQEGLATK